MGGNNATDFLANVVKNIRLKVGAGKDFTPFLELSKLLRAEALRVIQ